MRTSFSERIYELVRQIPPGKVMTYGGVAEALGRPRAGRAVGTALKYCGESSDPVPWYRVLAASGRPSPDGDPNRPAKQRRLLQKEGVHFDPNGACDLESHEWIPPSLERLILEGESWDASPATPKLPLDLS